MEEREKDMRRRKLGVLRVSPAIFQAVFLQDNGFNRDLIKIIQMACPAINSIWEFPRHRKLFHVLFVCFRAIYDIPINFANKSPISLVTFGRDFYVPLNHLFSINNKNVIYKKYKVKPLVKVLSHINPREPHLGHSPSVACLFILHKRKFAKTNDKQIFSRA